MKILTPIQQEIVAIIKSYRGKRYPCLDEKRVIIEAWLNDIDTSTAHFTLRWLMEKGIVQKKNGKLEVIDCEFTTIEAEEMDEISSQEIQGILSRKVKELAMIKNEIQKRNENLESWKRKYRALYREIKFTKEVYQIIINNLSTLKGMVK